MFYFFKLQYLWLDIAGVLKAFAVCLGNTVTRSADLCLSMYLLLCVAVILNTPGVFPLCGIIHSPSGVKGIVHPNIGFTPPQAFQDEDVFVSLELEKCSVPWLPH